MVLCVAGCEQAGALASLLTDSLVDTTSQLEEEAGNTVKVEKLAEKPRR